MYRFPDLPGSFENDDYPIWASLHRSGNYFTLSVPEIACCRTCSKPYLQEPCASGNTDLTPLQEAVIVHALNRKCLYACVWGVVVATIYEIYLSLRVMFIVHFLATDPRSEFRITTIRQSSTCVTIFISYVSDMCCSGHGQNVIVQLTMEEGTDLGLKFSFIACPDLICLFWAWAGRDRA